MNKQVQTVLLLITVSVGAIIAGKWIAQEATFKLAFAAVCGLSLLFVFVFNRYTWFAGLLLFSLSPNFFTLGFRIGANEIGALIATLSILSHIITDRSLPRVRPINSIYWYGWLQLCLCLWVFYVLIHSGFFISLAEFGRKNIVKSYFPALILFLLLLIYSHYPYLMRLPKRFLFKGYLAMLIGTSIGLALRLYQIISIGSGTELDPTGVRAFYIPYIQLQENIYILRSISYWLVGVATTLLTSRVARPTSIFEIGMLWISLPIAVLSGVVSGGRVTVFLCFLVCIGILILRRKFRTVVFLGIISLVGFVGVNLVVRATGDSTPTIVLRSLNFLLIEKEVSVEASISASNVWRIELARKAIEEWKSEPEIIFFGRATRGWGWEDEFIGLLGDIYYLSIDSSLRRGATHNLVTDLLIQYGLYGLVLQVGILACIALVVWGVFRDDHFSGDLKELSILIFVIILIIYPFSVIAGSMISGIFWWFLVLFLSAVGREDESDEMELGEPGL